MPRPTQCWTTIYWASEDEKEAWKSEASRAKVSLNTYIFSMAQQGRNGNRNKAERRDLVEEVAGLRNRCLRLEEELRFMKINYDLALAEIYKSKYRGFETAFSPGVLEYDKSLIDLLRQGGNHSTGEILHALGIDPRDSQVMKLVGNQLKELQRLGLCKEGPQGWKWIESTTDY
jgi:predicted HicB family RNase H-like nuclease